MIIFYGLGNNEEKYLETKHNVGRMVVEDLANKLNLTFSKKDNFFYTKSKIEGEDVYFVYSSGYMNNSGGPLSSFVKYFNLDLTKEKSALIIVHDDSDQIEGSVKLVQGGGSAGHNGIIDIYKNVLSLSVTMKNIWRLKIGIRPQNNKQKSMDFVLKKVGNKEKKNLDDLTKKIFDIFDDFAKNNFDKVQNILNTKE